VSPNFRNTPSFIVRQLREQAHFGREPRDCPVIENTYTIPYNIIMSFPVVEDIVSLILYATQYITKANIAMNCFVAQLIAINTFS
jgi:hypothetical protein